MCCSFSRCICNFTFVIFYPFLSFGFLSFDDRDHGWRDGSDPLTWLQTELDQAGLGHKVEDFTVEVLTMPRVLNFVFNPVSFWYLRDGAGRVMVIVAEVNNTFGGTHSYVLHQDGAPITGDEWITTPKQLYVSPFFKVEGYYRFCFRHGDEQTREEPHPQRAET